MKACVKCGCTKERGCLEIDAEGNAHPCYWAKTDVCSACAFRAYRPPPAFERGAEVVLTEVTWGPAAPHLAGMVARPRR